MVALRVRRDAHVGRKSETACASAGRVSTGISTIADTWIHVSYVVQDGERNRALTIVKSRGTGHCCCPAGGGHGHQSPARTVDRRTCLHRVP